MNRSVAYVVNRDLIKVRHLSVSKVNLPFIFLYQTSSLLPSNRNRSTLVHSLVSSLGLLSPTGGEANSLRVLQPRTASAAELTNYHDSDFVEFILSKDACQQDLEHYSRFGIEDVT